MITIILSLAVIACTLLCVLVVAAMAAEAGETNRGLYGWRKGDK